MARPKTMDVFSDSCCPSVLTSTLAEADATDLARSFAALAEPTRLRIINLLAASETGEICACDFVAPLAKSQPTVSHHLKILAEAGLVVGDKRGRWIWYSLVPERLETLRDSLGR